MPLFTQSIYCLLDYLASICILYQLTGKLHYFFITTFDGPRTSLCLKDIQASRLQTSAEGDPTWNGTNLFLLSFLHGRKSLYTLSPIFLGPVRLAALVPPSYLHRRMNFSECAACQAHHTV